MMSKMSRKFVQRLDGTGVTSGPHVQTQLNTQQLCLKTLTQNLECVEFSRPESTELQALKLSGIFFL